MILSNQVGVIESSVKCLKSIAETTKKKDLALSAILLDTINTLENEVENLKQSLIKEGSLF